MPTPPPASQHPAPPGRAHRRGAAARVAPPAARGPSWRAPPLWGRRPRRGCAAWRAGRQAGAGTGGPSEYSRAAAVTEAGQQAPPQAPAAPATPPPPLQPPATPRAAPEEDLYAEALRVVQRARHVLKHAQHDVRHVVELLAGAQHAQALAAQQRRVALGHWRRQGGRQGGRSGVGGIQAGRRVRLDQQHGARSPASLATARPAAAGTRRAAAPRAPWAPSWQKRSTLSSECMCDSDVK